MKHRCQKGALALIMNYDWSGGFLLSTETDRQGEGRGGGEEME